MTPRATAKDERFSVRFLNVATDANGLALFSFARPNSVAVGEFITATATDPANNTSEFSSCVPVIAAIGTADLAVATLDSPDPVIVGTPLTYTITVTNNGPDAAPNVSLQNTLPASVNYVSATPSAGACTGTAVLTCLLGTLANGASATVTIVVTPTAIGQLANTVSATSMALADPPASNIATTQTAVVGPPQTFTVSNTNDSGAGSLRQAILDANAHPGADTIAFAIPGSGVRTITPTALPTITDPVTIDGTTQTGFVGSPLIELSGTTAGTVNGLVLNTSNSVIRGLIINRFANGAAISVQSGTVNDRIEGNWIGLSSAGAAAANGTGIRVSGSNHTIGGTTTAARNVVSGNTGSGIIVQDVTSSGNLVAGNYVGTNVAGTAAVANQGVQSGIFVQNASGNTISANVISGNTQHALTLVGATASGNVLQANLIGVAANNSAPLATAVSGSTS